MKRRMSQRDLRRLMKKTGISMEPLTGVNRVEIVLEGDEVIVVESPAVTQVKVSGQTTFQVIGETVRRERREPREQARPTGFREEDVVLVAQQTGVDSGTARAALERTDGDLAKAILMLKGK